MVNIDNVYNTVLVITNKDNRGYITPEEFNRLANQAPVSYTHLRAHETSLHLVCRLLLEKRTRSA